jgi:hypothetical protein
MRMCRSLYASIIESCTLLLCKTPTNRDVRRGGFGGLTPSLKIEIPAGGYRLDTFYKPRITFFLLWTPLQNRKSPPPFKKVLRTCLPTKNILSRIYVSLNLFAQGLYFVDETKPSFIMSHSIQKLFVIILLRQYCFTVQNNLFCVVGIIKMRNKTADKIN